ncbi:hypothetical protein [Paenibacillus sinopodophylli]|nr:hypothetical protein [Paenibacillus sinopodophylli]
MNQKWRCAVDQVIQLSEQEHKKLTLTFDVQYIDFLKMDKEPLGSYQ